MRSNLPPSMRLLSVLGLAAILLLPAGCDLSSSDEKVIVEQESPALAEAFERVRNSHGTARLGDLITESGIPVGSWDRMYSFSSATEESLNDGLGTKGLDWSGLPLRPTLSYKYSSIMAKSCSHTVTATHGTRLIGAQHQSPR